MNKIRSAIVVGDIVLIDFAIIQCVLILEKKNSVFSKA